jgi:hypothetical protein
MELLSFDRFAWAVSFFGHIALLLLLTMRGRARSFPLFTTYIASNIAKTVILYFILHDRPGDYSSAYWSMGVLDEALQFLVLLELALHVFRPTGVWAPDVWKTFAGLACASVIVALPLTWMAAPRSATLGRAFVLRGNFFSAALLSELFVAMLALSAVAGLPWKTHVARIAQGLGVYSMVCVAIDIVSRYLGNDDHAYKVLSHIRIGTYLACEGYWIVTLWQEAPAPRELPESMLTQIYALQRQVEYDLAKIRDWRRF